MNGPSRLPVVPGSPSHPGGNLGATPLLDAEEEVALAQRIEDARRARELLARGDVAGREERRALRARVAEGERAFERFVSANLRLVIRFATRFSRRSRLDFDDLLQEGAVGLVRAVERFDWRRGYRFSTYAAYWIQQAMQRGTARAEPGLRLPHDVHDAVIRVRAARTAIGDLGDEAEAIQRLSQATRLTPEQVEHALRCDYQVLSLDQRLGDEPGDATLDERVAIAPDAPAEDAVTQAVVAQALQRARPRLTSRQHHVLVGHFGLHGEPPRSLATLAEELGVGRETARLALRGALDTLAAIVGSQEDPGAAA